MYGHESGYTMVNPMTDYGPRMKQKVIAPVKMFIRIHRIPGWWFGTFLFFANSWDHGGGSTTNQIHVNPSLGE